MKNEIIRWYSFFLYSFKTIFCYVFIDWRKLGIKKNEIVADFGSGSRPLPRANIIVDKFLEGLSERPTDFVDNGAYIVQCDFSKMPFKDSAIDFSYSSHTVEHLYNLNEALKEMERVSKRGFITCPSAFREQIMAHKMHLWFVEENCGKIYFKGKQKPYPEFIGNYFDKLIASSKSYIWHNFERSLENEMFINYFWKDTIKYEIIQNPSDKSKVEKESEFESCNKKSVLVDIREKMIIFSSKLIRYFSGSKINIEEILCCPECWGGGIN